MMIKVHAQWWKYDDNVQYSENSGIYGKIKAAEEARISVAPFF